MALTLNLLIIAILTGLLIYNAVQSQKYHKDNKGLDIHTSEDGYKVGGLLYNDPDDRRIFVPKRTGGGYTINFGNKIGLILMIGLLGITTYLILGTI